MTNELERVVDHTMVDREVLKAKLQVLEEKLAASPIRAAVSAKEAPTYTADELSEQIVKEKELNWAILDAKKTLATDAEKWNIFSHSTTGTYPWGPDRGWVSAPNRLRRLFVDMMNGMGGEPALLTDVSIGDTGYLDQFVAANLTTPTSYGKDYYGRHFVVLKLRREGSDTPKVFCLFQRYADTLAIWAGAGEDRWTPANYEGDLDELETVLNGGTVKGFSLWVD